jgi:glycosyltransferase involved in cell wall biosynthesis
MAGMHLTKTRGGISTLTSAILDSRLRDFFDFEYVPTQAEDYGRFRKALLALASYVRFVRSCVMTDPDLVYVHLGSNASLYREGALVVTARFLGKKVVGHFHAGDIDDYYPIQPQAGQRFIRKALAACSVLIACSRASATQLETIVTDRRVEVIPNAIDVSEFKTGPRERRDQVMKLLFVGAIGKLKGECDLLEAIAILRRKGVRLRVSILGYGAEGLAAKCGELGIADIIDHLGAVSMADRIGFFKNADAFVLPTYAEAMPMSVIEAMAAGLAIVATEVGGIPEIIASGVNGLLVKAGDPEALAESIERLATDPALRIRLGSNAQRDASGNFDIEPYCERLRQLLMREVNETK